MKNIRSLFSWLVRSQLSVQVLTRLSSVVMFLLASWASHELALIALQGMLLAIPMALIDSMVGKPLAAGVVPESWSLRSWALRASVVVCVPVAIVAFATTFPTFPELSLATRALLIAPVVLQIPLEGLFWVSTRIDSVRRANLIPQATAVGTMALAGVMVATHTSILYAPVIAQVVVLAWALGRSTTAERRKVRPPLLKAPTPGLSYVIVAGVELFVFSVALPSVAGALAGATALVVLRAFEIAFGPFHVALSATTREDMVSRGGSRFFTATRLLTVAALVTVSVVIVMSPKVRGLLATDLGKVGAALVALYCVYKALVMVSTWVSVRHMIEARPRQFTVTALGARGVALIAVATSVLWVSNLADVITQLVVCELVVMCWLLYRHYQLRQWVATGENAMEA